MNVNQRLFSWRLCGLFFVLMALIGLRIPSAQAADVTVSTEAELIAAINTANSNGQDDVISLAADIELTTVGYSDLLFGTGNTGLPLIGSTITIHQAVPIATVIIEG